MKIEPINNPNKIQSEEIVKFENHINAILPKDYRAFLLKYNGGRPDPNIFKTKNKKYETDIQLFYGLRTFKNYANLDYHYKILKERIPKSSIAIANDSTGSFILLRLDSGKVYLFDHEIEKVYIIAESFNSFISNLYNLKIQETEIDKALKTKNTAYFKKLINSGIGIDEIKNEFDQPIPIVAAMYGNMKILRFFIEKGASSNGILHNAARRGRTELVEYILTLPNIDIDERDETINNNTVLIQASQSGYFEIVKMLVEKGADLSKVDDFGNNALDKARWGDNQELIRYLEKKYKIRN